MRTLDDARVDVGVLLAPFLSEGFSLDDAASLRRANAHLARLVKGREDRLAGFAVVDPRDPEAPMHLRHAIETLGLGGAKMVPTGWYPSGIFIDSRSGRFCRPTFFEALREHPGLKVCLAHLGWPWVDEAIAVGLIDRILGVPAEQCMFRFDISFGPPPQYRKEALGRALEVFGPELLQFGSDCFLPCSGAEIAERMGWVHSLLDELEVDADARRHLWGGTAAAWLGRADAGSPRDPNLASSPDADRSNADASDRPFSLRDVCC